MDEESRKKLDELHQIAIEGDDEDEPNGVLVRGKQFLDAWDIWRNAFIILMKVVSIVIGLGVFVYDLFRFFKDHYK